MTEPRARSTFAPAHSADAPDTERCPVCGGSGTIRSMNGHPELGIALSLASPVAGGIASMALDGAAVHEPCTACGGDGRVSEQLEGEIYDRKNHAMMWPLIIFAIIVITLCMVVWLSGASTDLTTAVNQTGSTAGPVEPR